MRWRRHVDQLKDTAVALQQSATQPAPLLPSQEVQPRPQPAPQLPDQPVAPPGPAPDNGQHTRSGRAVKPSSRYSSLEYDLK